jgi:3-hydroxyacyl-CoA dehydrogenase
VRKVAVLGAGVMGGQIAAHLVNARVEALLFDLPAKEGPKSGIAMAAIEALKKMNPAPLGHLELAAHIQPANYDDDLELLRGCDLVIEAIAERIDWKHALYERVAPFIAPQAIFGTNTSGLSIGELAEGVGDELKRRFCGIHFFNPPRYMPLVELIATPQTAQDVLDRLEGFLTSTLGKHCIRAKDTPNFIANRVGIWGMLATVREAERFGLTIDIVDDLTGARLGRAKSGTFRTADVVGLDTIGHVMKTMQDQLPNDPFRPLYDTPAVFAALLGKGALGQKSGAGFYRKDGKSILRYDAASGEYVPSGAKADETVARILKKKTWAERLTLLRQSKNPQARFVWALMRDNFQYAVIQLAGIAENARDLDLALRLGYGAKEGPFEIWQQAGWTQLAEWIREDIARGEALSAQALPDWVFEGPVAERGGVHQPEGSWSPTARAFLPRREHPVHGRQLFRPAVAGEQARHPAGAGRTVFEDDSLRLWTLDESGVNGVLIATIRTRMGAIGPGVVAGLMKGVELAEREYKGLVVWSPEDPFSVGADLQAMLPVFMSGGVQAIEAEERKLQEVMLRLRYALVPTVAAVSGMALGGGCELLLHCAARVASLESYIGLVEVGVGLIPGAGGLTYGARRAAEEQAAAPDAYLLDFLKKYVMAAGTAQVSRSATEARAAGWLLDSDRIVFNREELLYVALREAAALHESGWRPPRRAPFRAAGREGIATITAQLVNLRDGGLISPHDFHLGRTIAEVMCGGDIEPGSLVDEEWIMALERTAFVGLLTHPKTQERIMGMMQTGKPVRN